MKILIVRCYPSYMDVVNNTYNIQELGLAKALVRKGKICDLLFWTDSENKDVKVEFDDNKIVNVYYRKGITFLKNTIYKDCDELFDRYDVIQTAEYNQIQSWILAHRKNCIIYHGPYYSSFNKRYNFMCRFFDAFFKNYYIKSNTKFITKSELAKQFLINKGIKEQNVKTIGVGIDVQMLGDENNVCTENVYNEMLNDKDEIKLLYIGRIEERRNILFILDVFAELKKEYDNIKLYIIGSGEKEYEILVDDKIKELKIDNDVVRQRKIQQKYLSNIYKLSDIFLLPTKYEIFGMVILEAMYYGTVVITTQNGGSNTLIKNNENGIIYDELDKNKWAQAIKHILLNQKLKLEIEKNAHDTICEKYTWDAMSLQFIEQYNNLNHV